MAKKFNELFGGSTNNGPINTCLFSDECPTGYFTKEEFVNHLHMLSGDDTLKWQGNHLGILFAYFKSGGNLSREPQHTIDSGKNVTWLKLNMGKVIKPIKILHFAGMKQLIDDYASGLLKVNQTLEELYDEALS